MTGVPRVRRYPYRPIVRPNPSERVSVYTGSGWVHFPSHLVTFDFVNGIVHHPDRPLSRPVSEENPQ